MLRECFLHNLTGMLLILFVQCQSGIGRSAEADATTEVLELACTGIGSHDDDRIAEVNETSVAISQPTFVQYL